MKTYLTKLSSSLFLFSLSLSLWAKPVAQVSHIKGQVFMVTAEGKTSVLKLKDHLEDKTEVLVEEGASITLSDFYDASYQLTGGSHVKFFNKSVQLKKGKAWVEAKNERHSLVLTTANGHIDFSKGEFITTFEHSTNKTQVLVVNGETGVSNLLNKSLRVLVSGGTFSLIDPDINNGEPRAPMRVGPQSLESAVSEFKKGPPVTPLFEVMPKREIASVSDVKKGEIIFISSQRRPASVAPGAAHKYYKNVVSKKVKQQVIQFVPIKFYGLNSVALTEEKPTQRLPASMAPLTPEKKMTPPEMKNDPEFSQSLMRHEGDQPRNPEDLQNLIDDLKSY